MHDGNRQEITPAELARGALQDTEDAWSIGTFGAIGEFMRDPDESAAVTMTETGGSVLTARGGLRIAVPEGVRAVAHETLSARPDSWSHGVVFCVPEDRAARHARHSLTELGADEDALRSKDRDAVLFDMGLGAPHVDVFVRTDDPGLLAVLRAGEGQGLLDPDNRAMAAIKDASPHRVFVSCLGRIEVYQPIGKTVTPEGPHTHVLPDLLRHRRTHAATIPVPQGYLPCLNLYPPSSLRDVTGRAIAFDRGRFGRFDDLLQRFAPDGYVAEKRRVMAAVRAGEPPRACDPDCSRAARLGARIALRQLSHLDGESETLAAWRTQFEPARGPSRAHADPA